MRKENVKLVICLLFLSPISFGQEWNNVKNVLTTRCVACHSCYTSPCQVNLTSYAGLSRGGSKERVYDGTRFTPATPTRMYIDAHSTKEWRDKFGFFPIIPEGRHNGSLLMKSLDLGKFRGNQYIGKEFDVMKNQVCPANYDQWKPFEKDLLRGMPFGFPTLSSSEYSILQKWAHAGYKAEELSVNEQLAKLPRDIKKEIKKWEDFLNRNSLKQRIVARYVYEHWFIAHLSFKAGSPYFFRLIRSSTASPGTPLEVATRRPFDDPGIANVYYRFVPVQGPIMHKNHIVYLVDHNNFRFVGDELLGGRWVKEPKSFPPYGDSGANPISTFQAMPVKGRYKFFLRDARYFAMTFIKGPVCEGQIAVNVIEDQFQVFFLDPDFDLSVKEPDYLTEAASYLELPAMGESDPIDSFYLRHKKQQLKYLKFRAERYKRQPTLQYNLKSIWDGDGYDPDAVLTIFRHFDNAGVIKRAWGGPPKTLWIMDYPIFERMYYLLVAGFDVFGNVFHQASTRMYMDNLRMEAENNYMYLFDPKTREAIRDSWYVGTWAREKIAEANPLHSDSYRFDSKAPQAHGHPQKAIQQMRDTILTSRLKKVVNAKDTYYASQNTSPLKDLVDVRGEFTSFMPELTLLVLRGKSGRKPETVFLSKVIAHTNVSFLIGEGGRIEPKDDRLSIVDQWIGGFPNYLIVLDKEKLPEFVAKLRKTKSQKAVDSVLGAYGLTRADKDFWAQYDFVEDTLRDQFKIDEYGRLDLSKYANIYAK